MNSERLLLFITFEKVSRLIGKSGRRKDKSFNTEYIKTEKFFQRYKPPVVVATVTSNDINPLFYGFFKQLLRILRLKQSIEPSKKIDRKLLENRVCFQVSMKLSMKLETTIFLSKTVISRKHLQQSSAADSFIPMNFFTSTKIKRTP